MLCGWRSASSNDCADGSRRHEPRKMLIRNAVRHDASDGGSRPRDDRGFQDRADSDDGECRAQSRASHADPLSRRRPAGPARHRAGGRWRQRRRRAGRGATIAQLGASVDVILGQPPSAMSEIPAHQLEIVERMDISVMAASAVANLAPATVILDGLIGYGLKGPPRGAVAALIRWANGQSAPTLALDVPSGVDTTNGPFFEPVIHAAATMTLALPKEGLRTPGVERLVGELYLADIGVPPALYRRPPL